MVDWDSIQAGLILIGMLATVVFVVSSMVQMGLSLTTKQIADPLRDKKLVILALVANFVIVPLVAIGLTILFPLNEGYTIGLLCVGFAAGAPFLPKLAEVAKGDMAFSVGLMVLLMVATIVFMPIALPLALEGVTVDPLDIAKSLVVLMLIPLCIALYVRHKWEAIALKFHPFAGKISNIGLVVLVVAFFAAYFSDLLGVIGTTAILAVVVFVIIAFGAGYVSGGSKGDIRSVSGLGTGQRNLSAATAVAGMNFDDPDVMIMVLVVSLVGVAILFAIAKQLGGKAEGVEGERS